ncbi:diguanylate cyclase [Vibrio vulnificus]|uniref:GGDEF domain-containing protein n=1 Tax=Vibrio vulnificus TaxID=672 RepID=UPI00034D3FE3|nr:GGDEF domain-containing protein [Vibrio vulnificus]EWS68473.1 diguanylate cyclase [Vibrio vulnificus BAA87]KFK58108.1 diguanylate cyclase [Vibrio vulnificus]KFK64488.1 diguanylate cyclase [Vibrio vulnificus]KFK67076.1 diguanylate cyclase [Vibrio vulnificus]NHE85878.1 GGDEF domain-containing protein [Vibrio vulnificus]
MNRLSFKMFLILSPLALFVAIFGYVYYQARINLMVEHIRQSSQLAIAQGAKEISHYIDRRFSEFDLVSAHLAQCQDEHAVTERMEDAISFASGFSMLLLTDTKGSIIDSVFSANKSNRYILRQDISGLIAYDEFTKKQLSLSYQQWLIDQPINQAKEQLVYEKLQKLKSRGEENSIESRELRNQLNNLRSIKSLPRPVVSLMPAEYIAQLGLIFDNETYFLSRPLVDCAGELKGYYTAVLDRTLIEDQIFEIKSTLVNDNINQVDVSIMTKLNRRLLMPTKYLNAEALKEYGPNATSSPWLRPDLGGVLINQDIYISPSWGHRFTRASGLNVAQHELGLCLLAFIDIEELNSENRHILREVLAYVGAALIVFLLLTLYLARYVGVPIERLRRQAKALEKGKEQQLTVLAQQDSLTGVLNRRALIEAANIQRRVNDKIGVCMMDLDHFKTINDEYGHAAGDKVLKAFCQLVSQEIRQQDLFGRVGGEEFCLVLPDANLAQTLLIAERIRLSAEMVLGSVLELGDDMKVTVSIGATLWQCCNFERALFIADKALYRAKHEGRNQVQHALTEDDNGDYYH